MVQNFNWLKMENKGLKNNTKGVENSKKLCYNIYTKCRHFE